MSRPWRVFFLSFHRGSKHRWEHASGHRDPEGQLDRYYDGRVPVHLWRALNRRRPGGLFDFVETEVILGNGNPRAADITIVEHDGEKWVSVKERPRGVSTFDMPGIPQGKDWSYYRIPAGTRLPSGLCVVRDQFNARFNATH